MMTFAQFCARKRTVDDVSDHVPPEFAEMYSGPGIIYPGGLVIELSRVSDDYCLTIANHQKIGRLADLESELYYWAIRMEISEVMS